METPGSNCTWGIIIVKDTQKSYSESLTIDVTERQNGLG